MANKAEGRTVHIVCFGLMLRLRPPDYQGLVAGYQGLVLRYQALVGAGQAISEQLVRQECRTSYLIIFFPVPETT